MDREVTLQQLPESHNKPIVWKDLGAYVDKKLLVHPSVPPLSLVSSVVHYKVCDNCHRPIGINSLALHHQKCVEMKQNPKKRSAATSVAPATSVESTPQPSTPRPKKKYKKSQTQKEKEAANAAAAAALAASGQPIKPTKTKTVKKTRLAKAGTTSKQKGPVDVEKQCGVPLPNGGYCARSLTCKTHSMGAKRIVPGRSAPYDVLLQQYQKRNQAKLAANSALALQKKENEELSETAQEQARALDPDDETYLVLEGLSKNQPIPLERKIILPVRNRHKFLFMREAYANALIINGNANQKPQSAGDQTLANQAISGSIGGLQGRCALVNVDSKKVENDSATQAAANIPGEMYQVRAPLKEVLLTAQHNSMQQQLFQQQVMRRMQPRPSRTQ